jgi:hypothetical protein
LQFAREQTRDDKQQPIQRVCWNVVEVRSRR